MPLIIQYCFVYWLFAEVIVIPVLTFGLKFGKRDLKNKASVFPSWGVRCLKNKRIVINYGNDNTCILTAVLRYIIGINTKNTLSMIKLYYTCIYYDNLHRLARDTLKFDTKYTSS